MGVDYVRFSPDSTFVGVAHMDSNTYIFELDDAGKLSPWHKGIPEAAAPSHLRFNTEGNMLTVFTRDYEITYHNLDRLHKRTTRHPHPPDPDIAKWAGDPLPGGWDVEGLYQHDWDGTDLNDCAIDRDGKFIA